MKVSRFDKCEDGSFTDGNIVVTDVKTTIQWTKAVDENGKVITIPMWIAINCNVKNRSRLMARLTLCFVCKDGEGFNICSLTDTARFFDKGEKWEYYARTEDLGYCDPHDLIAGKVGYSKLRGKKIYEDMSRSNGKFKLYAIEEFADEPEEDSSGGLGKTE